MRRTTLLPSFSHISTSKMVVRSDPDDLNSYIESLVSHNHLESDGQAAQGLELDNELLESLRQSISSISTASNRVHSTDYSDQEEEDEDEITSSASLWRDLLRVASDLEEEEEMEEHQLQQQQRATQSSDSTSNSPSSKLLNHLNDTFHDESLQTSMIDSILSLLESDKSQDDVSISLAELVGFEQLDLVTELMAERKQVVSQLKGGRQMVSWLRWKRRIDKRRLGLELLHDLLFGLGTVS